MSKPLKVLDLFSGIGGFSLGLERAGMETVAFCEISPVCRHLLAHHWPEVRIYDDICTLSAERLAGDGITVDAICGGFPCQDLSYAGKGAGLAGERSGLWREYARLICELRPSVVIVENVAALLARGLGDVLGDLASLGYDAWWDCIPASAVGAPHRRDRLWIVAYARSEQHEGYGDAIRRSVAAQLSGADTDAGVSGWLHAQADTFDPDANGAGSHRAQIDQHGDAKLRHEQVGEPGSLGEDVANTARELRNRGGSVAEQDWRDEHANGGQDMGHADDVRQLQSQGCERHQWRRPGHAGWWSTEPNVGRVAHGVPARVDRLHGLGNAVVPQIPEILGRAILQARAA